MMIRFFFILTIFVSSCQEKQKGQTKETVQGIEVQEPKQDLEKTTAKGWQFLGFYEGSKLVENNQQLTYEILLWKNNKEFIGYLYQLWYVTDSNFNESQAKLVGKQADNHIELRGSFDNENFVLQIPAFNKNQFDLDIHFPKNPYNSLKAIEMNPKKLVKWSEPIKQATNKDKINAFVNNILQNEMRHSGY